MDQQVVANALTYTSGGGSFEAVQSWFLDRFYRSLTSALATQSQAHIDSILGAESVNQEGNPIPVSLLPTVIAESELNYISAQGLLIRDALIEIIDAFIDEHRAGRVEGPLHRHFRPYSKWWDLIARETRKSEHIQLMRYDTIRESDGSWKILESNTCCPGGVVHPGIIRQAWLQSPLGQATLGDEQPVEYPVYSTFSFVRHLIRVAQLSSDVEAPNIAICSYRGLYRAELATIKRMYSAMQERGEAPVGELLLGDILDIECAADGTVSLSGVTIHLIYNKIDPLAIDPKHTEIAGWVAAASSPKVEFLNSLGAMYLAEAKRSLAFLHDGQTRNILRSGPALAGPIERHIPWTRSLPDSGTPGDEKGALDQAALPSLWLNRHKYVLKPDLLTRGEGICIGANLTADEWFMAIVRGIGDQGVVQELVAIPTRCGFRGADVDKPERHYWGIELMYFGREFAGPVSRARNQMIINVGAGGAESPTLVFGQLDK